MDKCLKESLNKVPSHWKKQSKIYGEACEFWISDNYSCPVCEHGALLKLKANMKSRLQLVQLITKTNGT